MMPVEPNGNDWHRSRLGPSVLGAYHDKIRLVTGASPLFV